MSTGFFKGGFDILRLYNFKLAGFFPVIQLVGNCLKKD